MKLKNGFVTHTAGNEQIMVAAGKAKFSGLVRSNRTAAFIVDCLKKETNEDEIVAKMVKKYDAPKEVISSDVKKTLETLRSIGALDE